MRFSQDLLRKLRGLLDEPWIVGGDFNEILSLLEKINGNDKSPLAILSFKMVLSYCNWVDMGFKGPTVTWINRWVWES